MKNMQITLIAAGAEAFEVTDNGFLLQEEALNNITSTLAENATEIASLKAAVKNSDSAVVATLTEELAAAKASIATLTTQLAEAQEAKATAETALETEKNKPGANFANPNADADISDAQKEANAIHDKFFAAVAPKI